METELKDNNTILKPYTLLDIILISLKRRKLILILTGIIFVVSVILYFFVFEQIYFSDATIRSSVKSNSILGSLETGLPDLGGLGDIGLGGGKSAREIAGYEEILTSRRCIEPLITKFDLMNRDNQLYMEDAIKAFTKNKLILDENKISGSLSIGVYDKNPESAKQMVEFLLDELNKINIEINVLNAKNNREFIENRYIQAKDDLTKAEDTLKSFQVIYGISPDLQVKASAQAEFGLEGELKTEEIKLDVLKKILSPDQIEIKTQEAKINALQNQISKINASTNLNDFLRLGNSPQIVLSFLRLEREVEIQSKIVSFLLPVYEQSKIEEKKETPTIIILDKPYIAEKKSKPKRLTMVIISTFGAFLFFNLLFILYDLRFKELLRKIKLRRKEN